MKARFQCKPNIQYSKRTDHAAVDGKVKGAADRDQQVGDGDHDVHVVTPQLCDIRTCHGERTVE